MDMFHVRDVVLNLKSASCPVEKLTINLVSFIHNYTMGHAKIYNKMNHII